MGCARLDREESKREEGGLMIPAQITMNEARRLLDYRDGMLFWRHRASGRRADLRAVTLGNDRARIVIGGVKLDAKYIVWNWHHGLTKSLIRCADGDERNIAIENLEEAGEFIGPLSDHKKTKCPCCSQAVPVPTVDMIAFQCCLTNREKKILEAVWRGNGMPVFADRIFQAMYEDDPDGGPGQAKMYREFKVALHHARKKLKGSGVDVENIGYRKGYRLIIGEN